MKNGIGYNRKGYSFAKAIARYKKTGKVKFVGKGAAKGSGHRAGEEWGDRKQIDPESHVRRYSKNSPSFDEGVYISKSKRKMREHYSKAMSDAINSKKQ